MEESNRDGLTSLLTRQAIMEYIGELFRKIEEDKSLKKNGDRRFTIAFIDLDNFKFLNDNYGHIFGDHILLEVASVIRENLGIMGTAARYGGDEFLVVFENTTFEQTFIIMENIRREIKSHEFKITIGSEIKQAAMHCSIGLASYPRDGKDPQEVMRAADEALYRAKMEGRDRICVAAEEKKVAKTIYFTKKQVQRITEIAKQTKKTESDLYREAADFIIDDYEMMNERQDVQNLIRIHVGKNALRLVETANKTLDKGLIAATGEARKRIFDKTGLWVTGVRIQDNLELGENEISFIINNNETDRVEVDIDDPEIYGRLVRFILDNIIKSMKEI